MRDSEIYEKGYAGNASTVTPYPIDFQFLSAADLEVIVTDVDGNQLVLTPGFDYTVTRDSVTELGSFVTADAIPASSSVKIYRANVLTQGLDYVNSDTFPAESHEQALDRLTESVESIRAMAARALRVSPAVAELDPGDSGSPPNTVAGLGPSSEFLFRNSAELLSFMSLSAPVINQPTKTWANDSERALAVPDFLGQVGVQRDTGAIYVSNGLLAGNWAATIAGGVADLSITRDKLADGALAADVLGRAKMADLYVTLAKMNVDFITAMTAKTLLEDGDYIPGWSATDNAFPKFAGNVVDPVGSIVQSVVATYDANANLTGVIPADNTIPQITEGDQIISQAFTPRYSDSLILLDFKGFASDWTPGTGCYVSTGIFRSPVSDAKGASAVWHTTFDDPLPADVRATDLPGAGTFTYTVRIGRSSAGRIRMNGLGNSSLFAAASYSTLVIQEIKQ